MKYTILYFLDYGKSFGGAANTLLQQAILIKKAGHKVTIFISDYYGTEIDQGYERICKNSGITIQRLTYQICSHTEDIDIVCLIKNYNVVKEKIQQYKPAILHSIQINPMIELISRELKIPHIMNIYQMLPGSFSIKYMDIFPRFHICDSIYYYNMWKQYLQLDSICIRTVATSQQIKKKDLSACIEIYYVCVGDISPRKNQLNVIIAFAQALKAGIKGRLILYGNKSSAYADECERYIKENCLENSIILYGFCDDMQTAYKKADVLICGSTCESYPNVISEALANRLIIITTPVAGVPEVIRDKYNGYLCNDYSVESITEKILEFDKDRKKGNTGEILAHAYSTFEREHSENEISKKLSKYYEHVLSIKSDFDGLKVNDISKAFKEIIETYNLHISEFTEKRFAQVKIWYMYHIMKIINKKTHDNNFKYYIWGTGKYGKYVKELIDVFIEEISIEGFLDTYQQGTFLDKEIFLPDEVIRDENSVIFIGAINGQSDMIRQLENSNKQYNKDYFVLAPHSW